MHKEYKKLTAAQFRELISHIPSITQMFLDLDRQLANASKEQLANLFPGEHGLYCYLYELPLVSQLSLLVVGLNATEELKEMATSPDPQAALLASLEKEDIGVDLSLHPDFEKADVAGLSYVLIRNMRSMMTYGRSISSLVQDVRDNNNYDSLFKAIRMDRSSIGCPTIMNALAKAQITSNKAFFTRLRSALSGPSKKEWAGLDQMRYALLILRELGIDDLSEAALEELMVEELKVYRAPKGDARKNLRAHYRQSRNIKTI
ncbi:MAG: hypothetical protein HYX42_03275 [Polaromonas sp.]|uniref:hypothetical protein n=1 Tax=Polaromonas sp. TaxID=1869339 RepID=UPI0025F01B08|nr:hypothetical protein [Polaromonas sp.]MBI2725252.1 hypothetical protein [Polaromonas sp.]